MTLHNCPPPGPAIDRWVKGYPSTVSNYGHLLLEQRCDIDDELVDDLIPYFESAHGDARARFHEQLGIDLHPDAGTESAR